MAEKECDKCGKKTERKHLGKIRGKNLCRKCRKEVRENRRKETMKEAGIGKELTSLEREIKNTSQREYYRKRNPVTKRKKIIDDVPVPKGSTRGKVKQKNKTESYFGFQESQIMLRILMKRGLSFEEAKESIGAMKEELRTTREKLKKQNKSEEYIKTKEQQLLEELYNS